MPTFGGCSRLAAPWAECVWPSSRSIPGSSVHRRGVHTDLDTGRLVFTTGHCKTSGSATGPTTASVSSPASKVVLHHVTDGRVRAIAVGNELGPRRVGAFGGVAADTLARSDARSLAVVETGVQAWAQLCAIAAVRHLREVRVYSRSTDRRRTFAERAQADLNLPAEGVPNPEQAATGADMVVLATNSLTPVVDPA